MEYLLLTVGIIACAVLAIRSTQLLTAALWLAAVSMITALLLYLLGAREVAVIELSVGAGLVTVLFVFAISIAGDDAMQARPLIPKGLAWILIMLAVLLLGFLVLPAPENQPPTNESSFPLIFWQERAFDVLAQIALIFAGVLGVLGLFFEQKLPLPHLIKPAPIENAEPKTEAFHDDSDLTSETLLEEELV